MVEAAVEPAAVHVTVFVIAVPGEPLEFSGWIVIV